MRGVARLLLATLGGILATLLVTTATASASTTTTGDLGGLMLREYCQSKGFADAATDNGPTG